MRGETFGLIGSQKKKFRSRKLKLLYKKNPSKTATKLRNQIQYVLHSFSFPDLGKKMKNIFGRPQNSASFFSRVLKYD